MNRNTINASIVLTTCAFSLFSSTLLAQTISPSDAQMRAQAFVSQNHASHQAKGRAAELLLAYTSTHDAETCYYVFNNLSDGGFVIVSGNESAPAEILGYSDHGSFSYASAPDGLKWWLSQCDAEIQACIGQRDNRKAPSPRTSWHDDVPAMIKTQWGQGYPYNSAIPMGQEEEPPYAGCVPIAMAQVMNYHRWPLRGNGSYTYESYDSYASFYGHYSANFGQTTYDWNHILNTYDENSTQQEVDAVSTLVYHAGVAVHAKYGWYETSAYSPSVAYALSKYFGYDNSVLFVSRNYYSDYDWASLIHDQLEAGMPLYYSGGGHAFVCHGYDAETDTYAINWGWDGLCDGYYRLFGQDVLQAIDDEGHSHGSYDTYQDIVINVQPDFGGEPILSLCAYRDVTLSDGENESTSLYISAQDPKTVTVTGLNPVNYSNSDISFQLGAIVEYWATGKEFIFSSSDYIHTVGHGDIYSNYNSNGYKNIDISIPTSQLAYNGTYQVYPAFRLQGSDEWQKISLLYGNECQLITIQDGKELAPQEVTFSISGQTVEVGSTLQISHDPYYDGQIYYYSSNDYVASVDENGLITGLEDGWVTIYVEADDTGYYTQTYTSFDVSVLQWQMKDRSFAIADSLLLVGQTTQISYPGQQLGDVYYESTNPEVAEVDANGLVTAHSLGTTYLIVTAEEYQDYYWASTEVFILDVVKPELQYVDCRMKNQGFYCDKGDYITAIYKNFSPDKRLYAPRISANFSSSSFSTYIDGYVEPNEMVEHDFQIPDKLFDRAYKGQYSVSFRAGYDSHEFTQSFYIVDPLDITYTMTEAEWGTICLPFQAEVPESLTAYSVTSIRDNQLDLTPVDCLQMNKPYLLKGPAGDYLFHGPNTVDYFYPEFTDGLLWGSTRPSSDDDPNYVPVGNYVLQNHQGRVAFYRVSGDVPVSIGQFHAYLQPYSFYWDGAVASSYYSLPGATNAIEQVSSQSDRPAPAYDLQGIRIERQHPGLQISQGRVLFVK